MIVKVIVYDTGVVILNKEGQEIFTSNKLEDIKMGFSVMGNSKQHFRYFNAHWNKGIVTLDKPTKGYTF